MEKLLNSLATIPSEADGVALTVDPGFYVVGVLQRTSIQLDVRETDFTDTFECTWTLNFT